MIQMTLAVVVEKDELIKDCFKVVIYEVRNGRRELIGVPTRGVSKEYAEQLRPIVRYTCDYAIGVIIRSIQRIDLSFEEEASGGSIFHSRSK